MKKIFTLSMFSVFTLTAFSQRLLTEDFNYNTGLLSGVSGGVWDSTSGTGKLIPVVTGNLSYTGYITNPTLSRSVTLDTSTSSAEDVKADFTPQTSGTVYASLLLDITSDNFLNDNTKDSAEYFVSFLPSTSTTSYSGRLYARKGSAAGTFNLGISTAKYSSTAISWVNKNFTIGATNLVTIAYQIISGANNDVAKLWVNPTYSATEPTPQASSTYSTGSEPSDIGRLALRQSGSTSGGLSSTPKCIIDAIKISTTWADASLPVTLKSFTASLQNNKPLLQWITTNEINMSSYVVEKSSDAKNYTAVTTIAAKNGVSENTYSYTDIAALNGTIWYRIKMVDNDGSFVYSNAQPVSVKGILQLAIKGNLVQNSLIINHSASVAGAVLQVINANGIVVLKQSLVNNATETTINVSSLASGSYYLVYSNGSETASTKFIKQ